MTNLQNNSTHISIRWEEQKEHVPLFISSRKKEQNLKCCYKLENKNGKCDLAALWQQNQQYVYKRYTIGV